MDDFDRVLERVRSGKDKPPQSGPVDPKDKAEHEADVVAGRDRDPTRWRAVMERFGFEWLEPAELDLKVGRQTIQARPEGFLHALPEYWTRPHAEGQWRSNRMRMAFTLRELAANFTTPEAFANWIEDQILRKRAARAGIALPPRRR